MTNYEVVWLKFLQQEYRPLWKQNNPNHPCTSPDPTSNEWVEIARQRLQQLLQGNIEPCQQRCCQPACHGCTKENVLSLEKRFWTDAADTKSIIHQYLSDLPIVCPTCGRDISNLYDQESRFIENSLCPICECSKNEECIREKCKLCQDTGCELWIDWKRQQVYDDYVDREIKQVKDDILAVA